MLSQTVQLLPQTNGSSLPILEVLIINSAHDKEHNFMKRQLIHYFSTAVLAMAPAIHAQTQTSPKGKPITEVITIGEHVKRNRTEISADTERLFSIAGAVEDPLQAIFSMPGVTFSDDGEPVIRGSAPSDNAFYIDSVPAQKLYHIWGNSIFNKYVIQDFELHPAAFSSKFGNATGGVIDVTLREPKNIPLQTTASLSFLQAAALVESRISDNQAFYISARQSMLDKIVSEEDISEAEEGIIIDEKPASSDYQAKYVWNINPQNSLSLIAAGSADEVGAQLTERNNDVIVDPDLAGPLSYTEKFNSQGATWNWHSEDGSRELNAIATHLAEEADFFYGGNQYLKTDRDSTSLRVDYIQSIMDTHSVKVGVVYEGNKYDIDANQKFVNCSDFDADCPTVDAIVERYQNKVNIGRTTAYVEDEFRLNDKQSLTLGIHYSSDDYLKDARVEPRLRWNYQLNDSWNTYLALGQYSQLPALQFIVPGIGNPDLKTVKANHIVWGIGQEFSNGWSWKSDLYYKELSDIVISVTDPTAADFEKNYSNNAEGSAYGVEFLLNKDLTNKWDGWLALSLGKAERKDLIKNETLPFDYDRPVMLDLVANYHMNDRWSMGFKWKYQTGDRYTPITGVIRNARNASVLEPVYGKRNSETTPDYHRLDFRVQYKKEKPWGYWSVYADIINLYGRENVSGYEFAPNGFETTSERPAGFGENVPVATTVSDGAFPSIGVEVRF